MKRLADTHMPLRKYTRREYKLKLKPWITQRIICSRDYFVSRLQKIKTTYRFRNLQTIPKPRYSWQGFG